MAHNHFVYVVEHNKITKTETKKYYLENRDKIKN